MPKSTKHKKARVADFAKAKLKLGKGKQVANNATNTTISSKTIALPHQSLSEAPKGEPVSRRNHTLPELLVHSRHYSIPVRKEALLEIHQLLESYPSLLQQHLLPLVSSIAHLLSDPSPGLRSSTRSLLALVCDSLDADALENVSRGLILFTISSLSSLDEGVKIDALKVLDLLLERIPDEIVRGWDGAVDGASSHSVDGSLEDRGVGGKVVEALLGVLRVRNPGLAAAQGSFTTAASSDLSPASRLAVLSTLSRFLRAALYPAASTSTAPPPWYLSTSFSSTRSYSSFVASFPPQTSSSTLGSFEGHVIESFDLAFPNFDPDLSLDTLGLVVPAPTSHFCPNVGAAPSTLLSVLHPTLLSSFLDSAPSAFSPTELLTSTSSSSTSDLSTIIAVVGVARSLYYRELGGSVTPSHLSTEARKSLVALLGHASIYFPFGSDELRDRSSESTAHLLELNLAFSSLVSLLVLNPSNDPDSRRGLVGRKKKTANKMRKQEELATRIEAMVEHVEEWVVGALKGELTSKNQPLGVTLSSEAYEALIPTVWALLNQPDNESAGEDELWKAVLAHFAKANSGGEGKRLAFHFIARVVLLQTDPSYSNRFTIPDDSTPDSAIGQWLLSLPKYLWELGTKNVDTTESVLTFLQRVVASSPSGGVFSKATINALAPPFAPFFHLMHPSRGVMFGPFVKLPERVQDKALALVWYLRGVDAKLEASVEKAKKKLEKRVD